MQLAGTFIAENLKEILEMEKVGSRESGWDAIFKDPFKIPRDELLRYLIYLPVRVATTLERSSSQAMGQRISNMKTPLISMLESTLVIKQDQSQRSKQIEKVEEFDHNKIPMAVFSSSYPQGKNDGADVAWLEGEIRLISERKRQKCQLESPPIVCNSSVSGFRSVTDGADVSTSNVSLQSADSRNSLIEPSTSVELGSSSSARSSCLTQVLAVEGVEQRVDGGAANGNATRKRTFSLEEKSITEAPYKETSAKDSYLTGLQASLIKEQSDFLISAIRVLRYAKPNQSKELLDMLASPNIPVKKTHLLEQLIWMAKAYNKQALAEELMQYI